MCPTPPSIANWTCSVVREMHLRSSAHPSPAQAAVEEECVRVDPRVVGGKIHVGKLPASTLGAERLNVVDTVHCG
eukprot:4653223-Prymnesium_polylepis.1